LSILSRRLTPISSQRTFSWLILIGANLLWATSYVAAKFVLFHTSILFMLSLRMCISGVVLLPLVIWRRHDLHITWRDLPQLLVLAGIGFVFNKILEFAGLSLTTASDVALLITGESIFTAVLSWILLHERVQRRAIVALVIGFIGVYLIIERGLWPTIPTGGGLVRVLGDLLVIGALLMEAFYTIRGKSLLAKHSPLLVTSASIVGSMVFWLPVTGFELVHTGWQLPGWESLLSILWLAVICTVLAYLAWFQGLAHVNASSAALTLFIQPLFGPILAIILLHESLSLFTILGGLLIVISVYVISRQE
jgi:Predicted permease, DMT superfamily